MAAAVASLATVVQVSILTEAEYGCGMWQPF